jgi:hypothetical protein
MPPPPEPESLPLDPHACYLPAQLAAYLQVSEDTLETWRRRGGGPEYLKLKSGRIRYEGQAVLQWLASRRRRHTSEGEGGRPGR